jgi:hypothetical protein
MNAYIGGAAVLLSNRWKDALRAKFKLLKTVRTHYVSEVSITVLYKSLEIILSNLMFGKLYRLSIRTLLVVYIKQKMRSTYQELG